MCASEILFFTLKYIFLFVPGGMSDQLPRPKATRPTHGVYDGNTPTDSYRSEEERLPGDSFAVNDYEWAGQAENWPSETTDKWLPSSQKDINGSGKSISL
jgi:hypothetical protein